MANPLAAKVKKLLAQARTMATTPTPNSTRRDLERYRYTPVKYMREVLKLDPWEKQQEAAIRLLEPPYRVELKSSHKSGKTFLAAALISWWYDTRTVDSAVITTAPTKQHVTDVLWREVRTQRRRAGLACDFRGDVSPVMSDADDHVAKGITTRSSEAFQGRHFRNMFFIFDEAIDIVRSIWDVTGTMFEGGRGRTRLAGHLQPHRYLLASLRRRTLLRPRRQPELARRLHVGHPTSQHHRGTGGR